jgi:hypothetical protein
VAVGGTIDEHFSFSWDARNVENRSSTHLMFEDDVNIHDAGSRGSVGQGTTPSALVRDEDNNVVGAVTLWLPQFTQPSNVFHVWTDEDEFETRIGTCLQPEEPASVYFTPTGAEPEAGSYQLQSLCWTL